MSFHRQYGMFTPAELASLHDRLQKEAVPGESREQRENRAAKLLQRSAYVQLFAEPWPSVEACSWRDRSREPAYE